MSLCNTLNTGDSNDIWLKSLNALQNEARPDPTNYNDINDNGSNNSVDNPMDITASIGYVETMEDYTDATDATENDENINYSEQDFEYPNAKVYSNDSSNNPEISDSLAFAIKFVKLAELNRVSRQVQRDM
ncbi:hypothetical protein INT46_010737, partial [Mucor plumbeus]